MTVMETAATETRMRIPLWAAFGSGEQTVLRPKDGGGARMRLDDRELERLLTEGESFHVERKESVQGRAPNTIREAVCAFANDLPGSGRPGVVFVGVTDDGQSAGGEITDAILRRLTDVKTDGQIVPPPSMFVEKRRLNDMDLAVVTVVPSDSPPVRYRGRIHVRTGPRRGTATAQDERILNEKRRAITTPFDIQPVPSVGLSALNLRRFEDEYLPRAVRFRDSRRERPQHG